MYISAITAGEGLLIKPQYLTAVSDRPTSQNNQEPDYGAILQAVRSCGEYSCPALRMLFVADDKIPLEIRNLPYFEKNMELVKSGNAITLGVSFRNGHFFPSSGNAGDRYCVIILPRNKLDSVTDRSWKDILTHEVGHTRQYFAGKKDGYEKTFRGIGDKLGGPSGQSLDKIPLYLLEYENYLNDLKRCLDEDNVGSVSYFCEKANIQAGFLTSSLKILKSSGHYEQAKALSKILDEILPKEEFDSLNISLRLCNSTDALAEIK